MLRSTQNRGTTVPASPTTLGGSNNPLDLPSTFAPDRLLALTFEPGFNKQVYSFGSTTTAIQPASGSRTSEKNRYLTTDARRLSSSGQLNTTEIGWSGSLSFDTATRKRWPSRVTS